MKKKTLVILVIIFSAVCVLVFNAFYREAKNTAIKKLNEAQVIHARQAALGIAEFFGTWTGILNSYAKMDEIISTDAAGKRHIELLYKSHQEQIRSITRMDERGTIIHTFPFSRSIGSNISEQKHVQEILKEHKPVISDVFRTVQGFYAVALHVPVFKGTVFKGTIAVVINFESLAKRYLDVIKIGETGYAWVISRDGTQLYSPVSGFTGKPVLENIKNYPSLIVMVHDMLKGHEGVSTYTFDRIGERNVGQVKKYAVYMPIHIENTFWSIVVASAEQDVLSGLVSFRNRLALMLGVIFLFGIVFSLLGTKAWLIVKEEERRRQAEEAIKASEKQLRELLDSSPVAIAVSDQQQNIIFLNKKFIEIFGYTLDDIPTVDAWWPLAYPDQAYRLKVQTEWLKAVEKAVREKTEIGPLEYGVTGRDGSVRDIQFRLAPVGDFSLVIINDITERKKVEEALREKERLLSESQRIAHVGSWSWNLTGPVKWTDELYRVYGVSPETFTPTIESFFDLVYPEDRPAMQEWFRACGAGESPADFEFRAVRPDGTVRFISGRGELVRDAGGRPIQMAGTAHDITTRKQAEEVLRARHAELENLYATTPVGLALLDRDLRFVRINEQLAAINGKPVEAHLGRTVEEALPELAPVLVPIYRRVLNGGEPVLDVEIHGAMPAEPGVLRDWLAGYHPLRAADGSVSGISIAVMEITERKQAEEALRESEKRLRNIIDGLGHDMFVGLLTPDGRVLEANQPALRAAGLKLEDIINKPVEDTYWFSYSESVKTQLRNAVDLAAGGKASRFDVEIRVGENQFIILDFSMQPLRNEAGSVVFLIPSALVITERKKAEEELNKYREHLEVLVKDRTAELKDSQTALISIVEDLNLKSEELRVANERLKEVDRLKSIFIASMSHELRTPLNSIIGFSSIIQNEWLGPVNKEQKENLKTILRAGKHLLNLINDVIDVSKIEAGKIESRTEDFDLHELIMEAAELVKKEASEKGLEFAIESMHIDLHTDRRRLMQCVVNLLSNAVKFTEKGSVRVQARLVDSDWRSVIGEKELTPDPQRPIPHGDFVEISVEDTGIGIMKEDMPRLFSSFVRLESPLKAKAPGTGLGLYLTKKIVTEVLKGNILVSSRHEEGSRFTLLIPTTRD